MDFNIDTINAERYERSHSRAVKSHGFGLSTPAIGIATHYFNQAEDVVKRKMSEPRGPGIPKEFFSVSHEKLTLIGIQGILTSAIGKDLYLNTVVAHLGNLAMIEARVAAMQEYSKSGYNKALKAAKKKFPRDRKKQLRSLNQTKGFPEWIPWSVPQRFHAGGWIVSAMSETPMFVRVPGVGQNKLNRERIALTEEALNIGLSCVDRAIARDSMFVPITRGPEPWVSGKLNLNDTSMRLVRSYSPVVRKAVEDTIKGGGMPKVLSAINSAQEVAYSINKFILDVVERCYENNIRVEGMPPKENIPLPEKEIKWEDMTPEQVKLWKARASLVYRSNASFTGQRIGLSLDLRTAKHLAGNPFWTPLNVDYRGRVVPIPNFNFQGPDYVRAMFQFEKGQELTTEGLYWLKVHVASTGDFKLADARKVSKAPFAERASWVDDNWDDLMDYAQDPIQYLGWTEADNPFMFLAGCRALLDWRDGFRCHLPIAFDGSCSGLQHLCAMTRDPSGSLVNLTPSEDPQDIYSMVATETLRLVQEDTKDPELAAEWMAEGITRSTSKRQTMTLPYGVTSRGARKQKLKDIMQKITIEVLEGKRDKHPFADEFLAASYITNKIEEALKGIVQKPLDTMDFLKKLTKVTSHEQKPLRYHTPLGFPVVVHYTPKECGQIKLTLFDKGVKRLFYPLVQQDTTGINKSKTERAIAPSFVHSMDACHLMMTVNACAEEGIELALVHDSFSCLPNEAPRLRSILVEQFYKLYSENDVLANIRNEVIAQMDDSSKVPPVPTYGTLDLSLIKQSEYAFS